MDILCEMDDLITYHFVKITVKKIEYLINKIARQFEKIGSIHDVQCTCWLMAPPNRRRS